jgi:hypothetical protein
MSYTALTVMIREASKEKPLRGRYTRVLFRPFPNYARRHCTGPAPSDAIDSGVQCDT